MVLVKAKVKLKGLRTGYSTDNVLVDSGARMTLIERQLAEHIGVEHTGRRVNFVSISGHEIKALEAIVLEMDIEGEVLRYEAVAVANIPSTVKDILRKNKLDEYIIIGILTLERANMIPNTTTGRLEKVESFII